MKLDKRKNGASLLVTLEGSLDTLTAPKLENELKTQWNDITELILDFSGVDYVSSAGLRVIMEADRRMGERGKMIIRNVNDDVRNVFEITGFDELLNLE